MFDVGFVEMIVVFVIALLVLGPERLPRVVRTVGLWIGRARAMFYSVRSELERELRVEEMRRAGYEIKDNLDVEKIRKLPETLQEQINPPPPSAPAEPAAVEKEKS